MLSAIPMLNHNNNAAIAQGYYGDSYSKYPTDDKKYECRTSPLEGFFVSSVEFCKNVKFDKDNDRKDNRTGTQTGLQGLSGCAGPQGIPGVMGPQELQSKSGITTLVAIKQYVFSYWKKDNATDGIFLI